ncbi:MULTISPECIES: phosphogluconate dehydratase [Rhizobium/Agrobacterium group]|jgi:phosphogluconate dehydratase|uniref:Phosphogluconate dehydratase n=2 Tax=Rhizobium/Agrobacterium group TaxID=227290 RepID=A0A1B9UD65_AGRTU|nr:MULTISPECIES: phosphogluconate dehydratase [Rhizobium/Agrobacterium group]AHK00460.1 phosphogluconate dehydratase [Agrobacterium tumefaciens LBA4213 (Ach5)]AKC06302.1 phosphogluconate dehydratase [Agrobacterium tumefaciens]EHJ98386.1 phosphogluconate dehydratase [Agrobacterium tumefaciens 5A]MDP9559666.1 phosphogluconate dehydratase [Rhizobium nepotum]QDG92278.1 phosphogluconate dehydratase [Rhizobium sp. NIBRBAC000502774]
MSADSRIQAITARIVERSKPYRETYLERLRLQVSKGVHRSTLSCGNLAHGFAVCSPADKDLLAGDRVGNLGIITAYNDMLSAHQPYETFPAIIREAAAQAGGVAQVAGAVPAMCDGVTQGQPGMELSLFSRDAIAMAAGIGLSHNMFDAAVYLGVCDKIVPGLVIAALSFGHLPSIFIPAGPMTTGLPNDEKSRIRQLYAEGKVGRAELLEAESKSYHGPGTCTFYGTANSNQMLMEIMGFHMPGSSFINPGTPLRDALTREAAKRALAITAQGNEFTPAGEMIDERSIVNGVVGLHATGGSTNHTMHLIAMARAAGIILTWQDISDLSDTVPLLARVYPNGLADVNHFHAAGGMGFLIKQLLKQGFVHDDVRTVFGQGLEAYTVDAKLDENGAVTREPSPEQSHDPKVLASIETPFQPTGGLKMLTGNLGKSVIKISAVKPERHIIEAPAIVFNDQQELQDAFKDGKLNRDFIAVVRFQGPKANGMPELHRLTPPLGVLQDRGFKVALVTDGRMSGASGKVPAAIHVTPEASECGPISLIRDGDIIRLDAISGTLEVLVPAAELAKREPARADLSANEWGMGRELFAPFRRNVGPADQGASVLFH